MEIHMTQAINTQVINALNSATAYGKAIEALRAATRGQLSPEVRERILPYVAAYYGVALVAKAQGEGVRLDAEAKKYEAAKKALQRLTADICGKVVAQKEEVTLTRAQQQAIKACMALGVTMKLYGQGVALINGK